MSRRPTSAPRRRKNMPLRARVVRGILAIEIGVATNAWAATHDGVIDPNFVVTDEEGFARDTVAALLDEREDGSSLLTDVLDAASRKAMDDGSEHFERVAPARTR